MSTPETRAPGAGATALTEPTAAAAQEAMQAAHSEIQVLTTDPTFSARYLGGGHREREVMSRLFQAAYPPQGETQGAASQPPPDKGAAPAPENAPVTRAEAGEAIPATAYSLPFPAEAQLGDATAIKQAEMVGAALGGAGIEPALGNALFARGVELWRGAGGRAPDAAALALAAAQANAELLRLHGDAANEVIARARAVVADAVRRDPRVAQWLTVSNLANDPWTVSTLGTLANLKYREGK